MRKNKIYISCEPNFQNFILVSVFAVLMNTGMYTDEHGILLKTLQWFEQTCAVVAKNMVKSRSNI